MKTTSIIALATAFAMSAPGLTLAQTSVLGTVNVSGGSGTDAAVSVDLGGSNNGADADVNVNLGGGNQGSGLDANANVNLGGNGGGTDRTLVVRVDINGDGTISNDELLRANAALSALGVNATVDINGDGSLSQDEIAAADAELSVNIGGNGSGGSVTASIDINGDGLLDGDELAAANAALEVALGVSVGVDLNGDGIITPDEIAAADDALVNGGNGGGGYALVKCGDTGLDAMIAGLGRPDLAVLASGKRVQVIGVTNCERADVSAVLKGQGAADIRTVLASNLIAIRAIQARNADLSDVLGATTNGGTVTVYIEASTTAG
jgi:hypothetical protein